MQPVADGKTTQRQECSLKEFGLREPVAGSLAATRVPDELRDA
jgi:hypothetical protein